MYTAMANALLEWPLGKLLWPSSSFEEERSEVHAGLREGDKPHDGISVEFVTGPHLESQSGLYLPTNSLLTSVISDVTTAAKIKSMKK